MTQWDSTLYSESEGFWVESHWCVRWGFGTQPHYEASWSSWPSGYTWNSVVINIWWVRLPLCQWPKVSLRAAKWLIYIKKLNKVYIYFYLIVLNVVFSKQANICCSISSISRPISSRDPNATDQETAMDYFRKLDNLFSGKQQRTVRTDQKFILSLSAIFASW